MQLAHGPGDIGLVDNNRPVEFLWTTTGADGAALNCTSPGVLRVVRGVIDASSNADWAYADDNEPELPAVLLDEREPFGADGLHRCVLDTVTFTQFYRPGYWYHVVLEGAVIDGVTVNAVLARFTLRDATAELILANQASHYQSAAMLYVHPAGLTTDEEAVRNDRTRPWRTLAGAINASQHGDTIVLLTYVVVDRPVHIPDGVNLIADPFSSTQIAITLEQSSASSYSSAGNAGDVEQPALYFHGAHRLAGFAIYKNEEQTWDGYCLYFLVDEEAVNYREERVISLTRVVIDSGDVGILRAQSSGSQSRVVATECWWRGGRSEIGDAYAEGMAGVVLDLRSCELTVAVSEPAAYCVVLNETGRLAAKDSAFIAAATGDNDAAVVHMTSDSAACNVEMSHCITRCFALGAGTGYTFSGPGNMVWSNLNNIDTVSEPTVTIYENTVHAHLISYAEALSPAEQVLVNTDNKLLANDSGQVTAYALTTAALNQIAGRLLLLPNNKIASDVSGAVLAILPSNAVGADQLAASAVSEIAAAILTTPANKLVTDGSGRVTVGAVASGGQTDVATAILVTPANKLATDGSGRVTVGAVASGGQTDVATAILVTPANKLATNGSGQVTAASVVGDVGGTVEGTRSGVALAADGLDDVLTTAPDGAAENFREMLVQLWRRFFKRTVMTVSGNSGTIVTYADDNTTAVTTQAITNTETEQTQGPAS